MTTVICKVDDRWYWGLENATMTFTSPKGGFVRIDKFKMRNLNDKQCELVWDLKERVNSNQVEMTIEEMKQLVEIGNIAGSVYVKKSK
jgi:hypothetical protein